MGEPLTIIIIASVLLVAGLALVATVLVRLVLARRRAAREAAEGPQYRRSANPEIELHEEAGRRAQLIDQQTAILVESIARGEGAPVRAVVSSPPGLGRNASLKRHLVRLMRDRHLVVPAEGLLSNHDVLLWLHAHEEQLATADAVVVDGMLSRGPGEGSVSAALVRLLSGEAVSVPRKYAEPIELRLKEGFSLVLSESDRNAQWASSVIASLAPEGAVLKELWL